MILAIIAMKKLLFFLLFITIGSHLISEEIMCSKKHILLTGSPGIGKSTIIKTVIRSFTGPVKGVYAEEENINGERTGFILHTLEGQSAYLAHENMLSEYRVGKYGVNVEAIESLVVPAISPFNDSLVIIDEIGLMQCYAPHFLDAVTITLNNAPCVLGTISLQNTEKLLAIKQRSDVQVIEVTPENRNSLPEIILHHLSLTAMKQSVAQDIPMKAIERPPGA